MEIIVVSYNPEWAIVYKNEVLEISRVLGNELVVIHHIGSTSVPGLSANLILM